ncbi:MAG: hypothetical protein ABIG10_04090 [bacterium]
MLRLLWYRKTILISLAILVIGFLGFWLFNSMRDAEQVMARNTNYPNLQGWAWTETIGWVSFNCTDTNTCDTPEINYGVYYDTANKYFKGYAWSENVGWIVFNEDAFAPPNYNFDNAVNDKCVGIDCESISDCTACFNEVDNRIYGWARVVSLGSDGWIALDNFAGGAVSFGVYNKDYSFTSLTEGSTYLDWGDLSGWAWNGGDPTADKKGIGWVSFNSSVNPVYKVIGKPDEINNINIERTDGYESTSLTINWNSNILGTERFEIWRKRVQKAEDNPGDWDADLIKINTIGSSASEYIDGPPSRSDLSWYREHKYVVMACNIFGCRLSNMVSEKTSPFMFPKDFYLKLSGVCYDETAPNTSYVDLEWEEIDEASWPGNFKKYQVQYCVLEEGEKDKDDCAIADWKNIDVDVSCDLTVIGICDDGITECVDDLACTCSKTCRDVLDNIPPPDPTRYSQRYNLHIYRVRAVGTDGLCDDGVTICINDSSCPLGGICLEDPDYTSYSSWLDSDRAVRPCPRRTQPEYKEVRPK